jgi:hypothetical protein
VHHRLPAVTPHGSKVQATATSELNRIHARQWYAHVAVTQALGLP